MKNKILDLNNYEIFTAPKNKILDLDKTIKDTKEKRQKEIKNLKSCSKQPYELVATENFTVDEVVAESYKTSFAPHSEMMFGGNSSIYQGGFISKLVLKVSPDNQNVPVRTINFDGISAVRVGDHISAQIPRYKEKRVNENVFHTGPYNEDKVFYFDRDFHIKESAIELALLSTDGNVLRKDRAINYKYFAKK